MSQPRLCPSIRQATLVPWHAISDMFGIDREMNLLIHFPVFIQPYIQKPLILYQLETVPVPILDTNTEAQSYTHIHVNKPYVALNSETYIALTQQELRS